MIINEFSLEDSCTVSAGDTAYSGCPFTLVEPAVVDLPIVDAPAPIVFDPIPPPLLPPTPVSYPIVTSPYNPLPCSIIPCFSPQPRPTTPPSIDVDIVGTLGLFLVGLALIIFYRKRKNK